ncbi:7-deoxyloganetin glucosyltransferase-like [Cornus florida]|uniref:7-deoxyloganetin glucosyltransferase-like n=1 Tax=Cornus florida TaxID=4283 RepID=UPI00289D8317|nr:7-deoxyloganetin glucosyltransferase-like [Cornus florida]
MALADKPHAVCIPFPHQSHIKATLKLAKLLHHKGFHITFVNTEFNHRRFLKSRGPNSLDGLPDFRFETIPDGLPASDSDSTQDPPIIGKSIRENCLAPFRDLLVKLNDTASSNVPPVTSIVSDGFMTFTITAAEEFGLPVVLLWTLSACGFMGFYQLRPLVERGLAPLKDPSDLTNGFLDAPVDWIPGMKNMRLKDLPIFFGTTDPNDIVFNYTMEATERAPKASAIVLHTFDALEPEVLNTLASMFPLVYTIGPLQLLLNQIPEQEQCLSSVGYNLWKEEVECLQWLNSKQPNSVIYVNFGSVVVMKPQEVLEFGLGLANSNHSFFWVIRPDLVVGDSAIFEPEFLEGIKERGFISGWCPQEQVLNHPSIGGFLTHSGWNSIVESLSAGVPMICCPVFADQQTNCLYACSEWGIGMEIDGDVRREKVEKVVRELMDGEEGKKVKKRALEWKRLAEEATRPRGSSALNLDKLVNEVLMSKS